MATKQKKNASQTPDKRGTELFEDSEALASQISKTEEFVKNNSTVVYGVLAVVVLAVAGILFFRYNSESKNIRAQREMFQAQYYFEQDSLSLALQGDGNNFGFLDIVDLYGNTEAGNLANFYVGAIYLKQGQYNDAIDHLKSFSANDYLVQARAYKLIGDAYLEQSNYDDAGSYYDRAAGYKPNEQFSPGYLMSAALAYDLAGDYEAAVKRYQQILDDFPSSSQEANAKRELARLQEKL